MISPEQPIGVEGGVPESWTRGVPPYDRNHRPVINSRRSFSGFFSRIRQPATICLAPPRQGNHIPCGLRSSSTSSRNSRTRCRMVSS